MSHNIIYPIGYVHPQPITSVSMRQARIALLQAGRLAEVGPAIDAIADPVVRQVAQIEWEYATEVRRDSPLVEQIGAALGMDAVALDNLFVQAAGV